MWRKCIFLVIKYIRFEDLLDYVHFVAKPLFYCHFAGVQQESLFQVFVNQVLLCVFSAGLLLKGKVSYDEVRMCGMGKAGCVNGWYSGLLPPGVRYR